MTGSRATRLAYYAIPMLFCVAVHWIALKTWFRTDDFAWLGLRFEIHSPHDLLDVLFGPRAQGTIRTISERLYFLIFSSFFGLNALPMRLWEFLTQFANIALLIAIARRLTGSSLAGFLAPILWCVCAASSIPLDWSSAYNEICCAFFVLLAFYLFLRYIDTGDRKFWIAQWIVFLLGFGALELNVMYPALAAGYALCCARPYFRRALYLFIPSAAFAELHFFYIPRTTAPDYALHFDSGLLYNIVNYWAFALSGWRPAPVDWRPVWLGIAITVAATAALSAFVVTRLRRGDWRGVFLIGWFFIMILPVLPLTHHTTEYYPLIPAIGVAILAAWAVATSKARWGYALAIMFLVVSMSEVHSTDKFFYSRARVMKHMVQGLEAHRTEYAGKKVLLNGVNNDIFWSGFADDPFRLIGIPEVYVTPGSEVDIDPHLEWGGIKRFTIPLDSAVHELSRNQAVVFGVTDQGVQDITPLYQSIANAEELARHSDTLDVGSPIYAERLGRGWYKIDNGARWMGKSATLQMGGPHKPGQKLIVDGYCPALAVAKGPVVLTISSDGKPLGKASLKKPDDSFTLEFPLPDELVGKDAIEITIDVNRTITLSSDPRELGLVFGTFRIK